MGILCESIKKSQDNKIEPAIFIYFAGAPTTKAVGSD
jgi:hypothetical protein